MAKSEKLPLSPMLVQYLVGLCALRWDASAVNVDVTLGDMVPDVASKKRRDVDVTVTVATADGVHAFKGYEVKHWGTPLDVGDVDSLINKFNDMPSVTHRAIASSSGYSDGALAKAQYHGIDLYTFKPWDRPISEQFPHLANMTGPPNEHIRSTPIDLYWDSGAKSWLGTESPSFTIAPEGAVYNERGESHPEYGTFGAYGGAIATRSTGILAPLQPIREMMLPLVAAILDRKPTPEDVEWPYAHTLDVAADEVYIRASDEKLYRIGSFTIYGLLKWKRKPVVYWVLEKVPTGEAFAGAIIAPSSFEGRMTVTIISAARAEISYCEVELEKSM